MYEFVGACPGFEVLYWRQDGTFHMEPVVAWSIAECNGVAKAFPITADIPLALDANLPVLAPDGTVRCDEEFWPTVWDWRDAMKKQQDEEAAKPVSITINTTNAAPGVLALDSFRKRFQQPPHGDGS